MRGAAKFVERCLWAIGFLALAVWGIIWLNAKWWQTEGNRELERRLEANAKVTKSRANRPAARAAGKVAGSGRQADLSTGVTARRQVRQGPRLADGDLIGRIEIPRLDVSSVIFEGDDNGVLRRGVGHMPQSALPGATGNVVLAAHRDTFFRALRNIRNRDRIDVVTPGGTREYVVDSMVIVSPNDVQVAAQTKDAKLTLITCYPFDWFGHAPKRFVVEARAVDGAKGAEVARIGPSAIGDQPHVIGRKEAPASMSVFK